MIDSTGTYMSIDCAAPFFFFDIELPSGRMYDKSVAEFIVSRVDEEDIPIIDENEEKIGMCVGANIVECGVVGRMVLLPRHKDLAEKWDMMTAQFSAALATNDSIENDVITVENVDEFPCIYVTI